MISINQPLPTFNLTGVISANPTNAFIQLTDQDYADQWKVIFFWPKDFTFVCPTEIVGFGKLHAEFLKRNTQILGASTDSEYVHLAWREHNAQLTHSPFPWLADIKKTFATELGILDEQAGVAHRATLIVSPDNLIKHISINESKVGRNPAEILRIIDALQTDELCPCEWQPGEETLTA